MNITCIILHYKNLSDTKKCLDSVSKLKTGKFKLNTIVIDNASEESQVSREGVFKLITNKKNLGFAGGVNAGIREALKDKETGYILILNNDVELPADLLIKLLESQGDISAPVIKFRFDGKWVYDYGGIINKWTGRTTHLESDKLNDAKYRDKQVDYVSGCCMLVKRSVFDKIGLFDEDYFFYFEDADFCLKAVRSGFKIKIVPDISVYHKMGGSVGRWTNKAIYYNLTGNFKFITKNLGIRMPVGYAYLFLLTVKIIAGKLSGK